MKMTYPVILNNAYKDIAYKIKAHHVVMAMSIVEREIHKPKVQHLFSTNIDQLKANNSKLDFISPPENELFKLCYQCNNALNISRYSAQSHLCNRVMSKLYTDFLTDNFHKPRNIWDSVNKALHRAPV